MGDKACGQYCSTVDVNDDEIYEENDEEEEGKEKKWRKGII